jgi:acetylornithine deacetylase/succinyl-diaminopimelate desuccinylase-like protein
VKTVLPNEAHAKITCRLVASQAPDKIADLIRVHVARVAPPGVTVTVTQLASKADPYLMASDHPANVAAHEVLEELYGRSPFYVRTGGSVPIYRLLQDNLGVYPLTFAFGLEDENLHAPNEFYRLSSFRRGQQGYCMLLERLGQ